MNTTAERVRVYWNVRKHVWSIQTKGPKGWRVTAASGDTLFLAHVDLKVSGRGRERSRRLGRKVVHAYVEGELVSYLPVDFEDRAYRVSYNPFISTGPHFQDNFTWQPVTEAQYVKLTAGGQAYYSDNL